MPAYEYLTDKEFLLKLDRQRLVQQHVKITCLDFNENPQDEITGNLKSGSVTIDGGSMIRRTASLDFAVNINNINSDILSNIDNLLSIARKIKVDIGVDNTTDEYDEYPIIWFPLGLFLITDITLKHSAQDTSVSLTLKDKMCLLNGECGGTIYAATRLDESVIGYDQFGTEITETPSMYQIIQEVVHHFGQEQVGKIIIRDLDRETKWCDTWIGTPQVFFDDDGNEISKEYYSTNPNYSKLYVYHKADSGSEGPEYLATLSESTPDGYEVYSTLDQQSDAGYTYNVFKYPEEEFTVNAGSSVCDVLEAIKSKLENYEYFYDLDGNFVFQEKKNYLYNSYATKVAKNPDEYTNDPYKDLYSYEFNDSNLIVSYQNQPVLSMIKNDIVIWGKKNPDEDYNILYHIAIDDKPQGFHSYDVYYDEDANRVTQYEEVEHYWDLPQPGIEGKYYKVNCRHVVRNVYPAGESVEKKHLSYLSQCEVDEEGNDNKHKHKITTSYNDIYTIYKWNEGLRAYERLPAYSMNNIRNFIKYRDSNDYYLNRKYILMADFNEEENSYNISRLDNSIIAKGPETMETLYKIREEIKKINENIVYAEDYMLQQDENFDIKDFEAAIEQNKHIMGLIDQINLFTIQVKEGDYRTELYLRSTELYGTGFTYYSPELLAHWEKIWDFRKNDFRTENKKGSFDFRKDGDYFLELIDTNSSVGKFKVSNIGRRSTVISDDNINCLIGVDFPDFILIDKYAENKDEIITKCNTNYQPYIICDLADPNRPGYWYSLEECLSTRQAWKSAYEVIRNMLYTHTSYNETIALTTTPIYYLEPNTLIKVEDKDSDISGDYVIKSYSINLDGSGTMNINATRAMKTI